MFAFIVRLPPVNGEIMLQAMGLPAYNLMLCEDSGTPKRCTHNYGISYFKKKLSNKLEKICAPELLKRCTGGFFLNERSNLCMFLFLNASSTLSIKQSKLETVHFKSNTDFSQ